MRRWHGVLVVAVMGAGLPAGMQPPVSAAASPCPADGSIAYGNTVSCSIEDGAEVDAFSFDAGAGDMVLVRMAATTTSSPGNLLASDFTFVNPSGQTVCQGATGSNRLWEGRCRLPTGGAHTLLVRGGTHVNPAFNWRGTYNLHLQSANHPVGATVAGFGSVLSGNVELVGELEAYTFDASSGDIVLLRGLPTSPGLRVHVRVFTPAGMDACLPLVSNPTIDRTCELNTGGRHVVLVSDVEDKTGSFSLYVQRTNNPGAVVTHDIGMGRSDTIGVPAFMTTHRYPGLSRGDQFLVRLGPSGNSIAPDVRVYGATGELLCRSTAAVGAVAEASCELPVAGHVTVLVGDASVGGGGGYRYYAQVLNRPERANPLTLGTGAPGAMSGSADLVVFTFTGAAGDQILLRLTPGDGQLRSEVRLHGPDGRRVCVEHATSGTAEIVCEPTQAGRQVVLVSVAQAGATFGLFADSTVTPAAPRLIGFHEVLDGRVPVPGAMETFSVSGRTGQLAVVSVEDATASLEPVVRGYGPDGTQLCAGPGSSGVRCRLDSSAGHHIFVGDAASAVGGYEIVVETPAFRIGETGGSTVVYESGAQDEYSISLATRPTHDVRVETVTDGQVAVEPAAAVFTPTDWAPETMRVRAVDDATPEGGPHSSTITHRVTSADPDYAPLIADTVGVVVVDDDTPGITLLPTEGATVVSETSGSDTYSVSLLSRPRDEVTVRLTTDGQLEASPGVLVFSAADWDRPQTVEVTAVDDGFDEPSPHESVVLHTASSLDSVYDGLTARHAVLITDDDLPLYYFALGDSVASGHGLADGGGLCTRSGTGSYPQLVQQTLGSAQTVLLRHHACSGTSAVSSGSEPTSRRLSHQVTQVLAERAETGSGAPGLVSMSVGSDELGMSDATTARSLLCEGSDASFDAIVAQRTEAIRTAVGSQVSRLLEDPLLTVVLAEHYTALNDRPTFLDDPAFVGGQARVPCDLDRAYSRAETITAAFNEGWAQIGAGTPAGARPRVMVAHVAQMFRGHGAASPGCGAGFPPEEATFVQYPGRGYSSANGGDCFHPNQAGSQALADAIINGRHAPPPDAVAPVCSITTANGSLLVSRLVAADTLAGSASDVGSGVSSVTVTFTPSVSALRPTVTDGARRCQGGGASCTWTARPPLDPGRYSASCRSTDRARNVSVESPPVEVIVL